MIKKTFFCKWLFALFFAVMLPACSIFPETHYYTLRAIENAQVLPGAEDYKRNVGVGPFMLPEIAIHPGLVFLNKEQGVTVSMYELWAGRANLMVQRIVADNLSRVLDNDAIWPFPWDNRNRPERQVRIVFEELIGYRGGDVFLKAKWIISANNGEQQLLSGGKRYVTQCKDDSYHAYVGAMNDAIALLSMDVARDLLKAD